jgi:beta-N-acetylhexosaminidase
MELRHAAGNLLVVGLAGTELSPMERAWLKLIQPAGIILFKRNIADAKQTRALIDESLAFCAPHAARCVDVEGGAVNRLKDAIAAIPSAQDVATAARRTGKAALAREHGELIARAVAAFGFNTTLAPVLDLALPESAEVLGSRCAAPDPTGVISYAREFLAGLGSREIVGCGKHFPGLGAGTLDSHQETPSIPREAATIWRDDLEPYRALCRQLPIVMVNHAAYPATPGRKQPASVSSYWIESVLRERIGYRGLVLSDDLEMGGILKFMPIEEAAVEAIRAGANLIEICHRAELILQTYEALIDEAEHSVTFRALLIERAHNTRRKRNRTFPDVLHPALDERQFEALRARILRFSETVAAAQSPEGRAS